MDAIVGTPRQMHTVLTEFCTGCDLCVPPCPVDCIEMVELGTLAALGNRHADKLAAQSLEDMAAIARNRYQFHRRRLERDNTEHAQPLAREADAELARLESPTAGHDLDRKKTAVRAAIERARARLAPRG